MKSFKQYILEQTEKSSYPWTRMNHGGWWHPSGQHATWNWDIDGGEFHVTKIMQSPEMFGLNHDNIHATITSNDPKNMSWRKYYGWNDEQLKQKLTNGIIDKYSPIENLAYQRGWVGVRRTKKNMSLMGSEPGLRSALDSASLHIPVSKLDTEKINLYDADKNENFDLTGYEQMKRYIKHGIIPS